MHTQGVYLGIRAHMCVVATVLYTCLQLVTPDKYDPMKMVQIKANSGFTSLYLYCIVVV